MFPQGLKHHRIPISVPGTEQVSPEGTQASKPAAPSLPCSAVGWPVFNAAFEHFACDAIEIKGAPFGERPVLHYS